MRQIGGSVQNHELLSAALEGLELQKERLEEQIRSVQQMLGRANGGRKAATKSVSSSESKPTKRRALSSAARKRIAAAQKKRWAEYRKTNPTKEA